MAIVGFDFGTTNSLVSLVRGNRAVNFLDEEQRPIPSVISYEGGQTIVGRSAKERLSQAGLGIQGNTIRSPKMFLGKDSIYVEGVERSPVDIVADIVSHVLQQARGGPHGSELSEVRAAIVTIPIDMEGYKRRALRDAFRIAGLPIAQYVHEPLAALYGLFRGDEFAATLRRLENKLILVFDWGGGTLDLTLCRPNSGMLVQLANDGTDEVGGDKFDEILRNSLVNRVATSRGYDAAVGTQPGAGARLLDRCERAKIDLSSRSSVSIYVGSYFRGVLEEEFDYSLDQAALEEIVLPVLNQGFRRIERVLSQAGFAPEQVSLCVATGGMSNMPIVKRRLHELFGPERVIVPDSAATLIAEGAAYIAADRAELQLAKNVELLLARNSYLPLVKSGATMPKEGEVQKETFNLYCTDPRDGVAKFQFFAPAKSGRSILLNDPRNYLGNLTVKVDSKAKIYRERLELDIGINDDLILEAHARSLNLRDEDRTEIHNLEFGLRLPRTEDSAPAGEPPEEDTYNEPSAAGGELTVRANISSSKDLALIPGEYLYQHDPKYFDVRNQPPKEQEDEKLYYEPCSGCGRASNDPACNCASHLPRV